MTSADCPPAAGMSLTSLGQLGSTSHHHRYSQSPQHPAPSMQRPAKPLVTSILTQETFAPLAQRPYTKNLCSSCPASLHKKPFLPQTISYPLLLLPVNSRISAASGTSQSSTSSARGCLHSSVTQICLLAIGSRRRIAGTNSASAQLLEPGEGEVRFILQRCCFSPLFSASSMRKALHSHSDSLKLGRAGLSAPEQPAGAGAGGEEDVAQLCWQQLPVCVCRDRGGHSLGPAQSHTALGFRHISLRLLPG